MKDLLKAYVNIENPFLKSKLWTDIVDKVDKIVMENNEDEYDTSLYYDEEYVHQINIEREAYKKGFIKAIEVLFLE